MDRWAAQEVGLMGGREHPGKEGLPLWKGWLDGLEIAFALQGVGWQVQISKDSPLTLSPRSCIARPLRRGLGHVK